MLNVNNVDVDVDVNNNEAEVIPFSRVKITDKILQAQNRPHIGVMAPGNRVSVNTPLHECQRPLAETRIHNYIELSGTVDWNLFGYITVVRYEDGSLAIIDGQHRVDLVKAVAPQVKELPAHIIDVNNDQYAAKLFAYLNGVAIRKVNNEELLWAEVIARMPAALNQKRVLELAGLSCGRVNEGVVPSVNRATFAKCLKLGETETVMAAQYIKAAFPDQGSIDLVLHGLTRLLTLEPYTSLTDTNKKLGQMFRDWFITELPNFMKYRDVCFKEYRNNSDWQIGIAYGIYDKFRVYMDRQGKLHQCKPIETIKDLYLKGLN